MRAPFDGVVTQIDALQPGTYLVSQTAALTDSGAVALVSSNQIWVTANMKETDLTYVRLGNHVDLSVDTYPGHLVGDSRASARPAVRKSDPAGPELEGQLGKSCASVRIRIGRCRRGRAARRDGVTVDTTGLKAPLSETPRSRSEGLHHDRDHLRKAGGRAIPWDLTACAMAYTLIRTLDNSSPTWRCPTSQGSLAATSTQITWVLTYSAAAIADGADRMLSGRFGRRIVHRQPGFTVTSMLRAGGPLTQIVVFRLLQECLAALVPLSQRRCRPIRSRARHGHGAMGHGRWWDITGPTLGGYRPTSTTGAGSSHQRAAQVVTVGCLWLFLKDDAPVRRGSTVSDLALSLGLARCSSCSTAASRRTGRLDGDRVYAVLCCLGYLFLVGMFTAGGR